MTFRLTQPRRELLCLVHRAGGELVESRGRLRSALEEMLTDASPTQVRRVIEDCERAGLIAADVRGRGLYRITLTPAGEELLRAKGLISDRPRRYLADPDLVRHERDFLAVLTTAADRARRYFDCDQLANDPDRLRRDLILAVHSLITPRMPEPEELAMEVGACRDVITRTADAFARDPDSIDVDDWDDAIMAVMDLRTLLIAARLAVHDPFAPDGGGPAPSGAPGATPDPAAV